ncbi:hypothetical protein EYR36_001588 [Pleurotus pulmonarius]|nr:hypothetical protein EYR36_001588 [Pleurotus pulmonarius]
MQQKRRLLEFSLQVGLQDMSYTVSVTHAKDEHPFSHLPPMWPATLFLTIFTLPLIETFYFWRIYKLLDKKWPSLMGIFVLFVRVGGWSLYNAKAREGKAPLENLAFVKAHFAPLYSVRDMPAINAEQSVSGTGHPSPPSLFFERNNSGTTNSDIKVGDTRICKADIYNSCD